MNLPGRLRLTTLGDLLGAVYREGATGVLELADARGKVHRIFVTGGLVGDVESDVPVAPLGEVLRARGLVDRRAVETALAAQANAPHRRIGDLLTVAGAVDAAAVRRALKAQRRERLERLFLLGDARIAFRVARSGKMASEPIEPRDFLFGRRRLRDGSGPRDATTAFRRRDPVRVRALATLGLTESADRSSVQRAFRQLASRMHPDRFPSANAEERADLMRRFAEVTAAYHSLVA